MIFKRHRLGKLTIGAAALTALILIGSLPAISADSPAASATAGKIDINREDSQIEDRLRLGVNYSLIEKPFTIDDILSVLSRLFDNRKPG